MIEAGEKAGCCKISGQRPSMIIDDAKTVKDSNQEGKAMKTFCISKERLTDYLEGRLSSDQRRQIESHLSDCDLCLEYVHIYRRVCSAASINKATVVPTGSTKRVISALERLDEGNLIDKLAGHIKALSLQWRRFFELNGIMGFAALEPIRGNKTKVADDMVLLNKTFSDLETEIAIEKIEHRLANVSVTIDNADTYKTPVRVSLMSDDRELASYLINMGDAYFESVPFGHYTLNFTRSGVLIGQYSFQIKETGNGTQETG